MTFRVVFTPESEDHLDELYRYIADAATPEIAAGYVDAIIAYCEGLSEFPHRGLARRLPPGLRRHWQPLMLSAGMGWLADERASAQAGRKPASHQARERAIQRLAERGLTADEIRRVLRRP